MPGEALPAHRGLALQVQNDAARPPKQTPKVCSIGDISTHLDRDAL